jgi:predicted anti-sigma-YlaC factor YlaD
VTISDTQAAPPAPDAAAPADDRPLDLIIRVAGWVLSVVAVVLSGLLELFFTPLRVFGVPVGASILLALVANPAIAWFAVTTTRRRSAVAPPWIIWTIMMLFATGYRTPEGDYLVSGNDWVALVMILVGSLAFAVYSYRMILRGRPAL